MLRNKHVSTNWTQKLKRILFSCALFITTFSATQAKAEEEPATPGPQAVPCPCGSLHNGHFFTGQYYPTKPVYYTTMPLDVFVGYTMIDSIVTYSGAMFPTWQERDSFIYALTKNGDTLNYGLRYLYNLADYNPFLYYNFMTSYQEGKLQPMSILPTILNKVKDEYGVSMQEVMKAEYILHTKVTKVFTGEAPELRYIHSQVLDTIKGKVLPNMNTAIEVFTEDSAWASVKKARPVNTPPETGFIYYYNPGLGGFGGEDIGEEYIIFCFSQGVCVNSSTGYQYYVTRPTKLGGDNGVFYIKNGNVLDQENVFGWGTSVPVEQFKQNLRTFVGTIKNYGK